MAVAAKTGAPDIKAEHHMGARAPFPVCVGVGVGGGGQSGGCRGRGQDGACQVSDFGEYFSRAYAF